MNSVQRRSSSISTKFIQWLDNHHQGQVVIDKGLGKDNTWTFPTSFVLVVLCPIAVIWVGWSPIALAVAVALYWIRMFGITGVYHRYFSHRTYKTSRWFQFVLALIGNSAAQRGPLWWGAHHRHHHKFSDMAEDAHSPMQGGFWNSHILWWGRNKNIPTKMDQIKDFSRYPELVFLDRFDSLVPIALGVFCFTLGWALNLLWPSLGTSSWQMLTWGFGISTLVLFNGVAVINSLAHVIGRKRFQSGDDSRNSFSLAFVTMGEGWHNNHHFYANSVRQGFYWYEWDPTYYLLWAMSKVGLVWDLKPVPERILALGRQGKANANIVRPMEPGVEEVLANAAVSPNLPSVGAET
jgi:stearoyl-CoA desaturase (Delta-9 desaturase)